MAAQNKFELNGVSRRGFLRLGSGAVLATAALSLTGACTPAAPGPGSPPAPAGATQASGGASATRVQLPSYVPFQGPKPDFAPSADAIVPPGYLTFPKQLADSVPAPVGKGEDVTFMTYTINPPGPPLEQNATWQQLNRELGVSLKWNTTALADWETKLSTVLASGELPDLFTINVLGRLIPNQVEFLKSVAADLTPYLAGDAVKAYPNLANYPPIAWRNVVFDNKLYALPRLTNSVGAIMLVKQNVLDDLGVKGFKNKDEFLAVLKDITRSGRMYGIGGVMATPTGLGWTGGLFRVPHQWREDGGKLTRSWETAEYKEAVAFLRDQWDAGVVVPETPTWSGNQGAQQFYASKMAMYPTNFFAYGIAWGRLLRLDREFRLNVVLPFGADGGKGVHYQEAGINQLTVIKKASAERVKLLLGVLNYLSAPFGSQEHANLYYGIKDVTYTLDESGNPALNDRGVQEVQYSPWGTISSPPPYLFDAGGVVDPAFVSQAHPQMMTAHDMAITDPTIGLYSNTNSSKGAMLTQAVVDGTNNIIFGREPVSSLDQVVKDWRTNGGDQIRSELETELARSR
jgi:putative aldouronate transport system substrate-binding protein